MLTGFVVGWTAAWVVVCAAYLWFTRGLWNFSLGRRLVPVFNTF